MAIPQFDPSTEQVIKQWITQLVDPLIQHAILNGGQVEIRLFTNGGKVRKNPVVLLNAGPNAMESIDG